MGPNILAAFDTIARIARSQHHARHVASLRSLVEAKQPKDADNASFLSNAMRIAVWAILPQWSCDMANFRGFVPQPEAWHRLCVGFDVLLGSGEVCACCFLMVFDVFLFIFAYDFV